MIFYEPFHRSLYDVPQRHVFGMQCVFERSTEVMSDRTVESNGRMLPSVVLFYVAHEEPTEVLNYEIVYAGIVKMLA